MSETDEDIIYTIALNMIHGVGPVLAKNLLNYCGCAKKVFHTPVQKLEKIPLIGEKTAQAIYSFSAFEQASIQIERVQKYGAKIYHYKHKQYPKRLKQIYDFPPILYYLGSADLNAGKVVGIVGTRNASAYGKNFVNKLVQNLARYKDLIIVSGLAYGIDIEAHKAALANNIITVGVVAHGLDTIYPSNHKSIAAIMSEQGGLISEYGFGIKPEIKFFPARNRIIAGLSDAIVVVESSLKGGALITAELANTYDREVFSLPGNIQYKYSEGCHALIKKHKAHLITESEDLAYIMGWEEVDAKRQKYTINWQSLSREETQIVKIIQHEEIIHIDKLAVEVALGLGDLLNILLHLELKGVIKTLPGKKYNLA